MPWGKTVLALFVMVGLLQACCASSPAQFQVFDALLYRHKPDLSGHGLQPLKPAARFWAPGQSMEEVNEPGVQAEMAKLQDYAGMVFIDIEHWPVHGVPEAVARHSIDKLARVADLVRASRPARTFGYYGVMPERVYWPIILQDAAALQRWEEANRRTEKLARHVDVIFPSLYTFYNDPVGWEKFARAMLKEARRYGKPVYVFLWPEFHTDDPALRDKPMPGKFWRRQLEVCRELADGIVLWGGWQRDWDDQAAWWLETRTFLAAQPSPAK